MGIKLLTPAACIPTSRLNYMCKSEFYADLFEIVSYEYFFFNS